jgi:hypothetical protein
MNHAILLSQTLICGIALFLLFLCVQIPIFLSMYRGLNGMAELPVVSMQTGGLLWFTDLTIQDPFYALPLMTVATLFVTIEVGLCFFITSDLLRDAVCIEFLFVIAQGNVCAVKLKIMESNISLIVTC